MRGDKHTDTTLHYTTLHYTTLHYTTLLYTLKASHSLQDVTRHLGNTILGYTLMISCFNIYRRSIHLSTSIMNRGIYILSININMLADMNNVLDDRIAPSL